jgi:hypothetical protein
MSFRDKQSFGKRQEFGVIAELLKLGFDVYTPLVDDQGIDCVIRINETKYLDVQIKARSKKAEQPNYFAALSFTPRSNYFFIFYLESENVSWIIPSKDVEQFGIKNKSGANIGKISITIPIRPTLKNYEVFEKEYKNRFDKLNLLL